MIAPQELRIGNLVIDELGMRECVLCGITNIDAHYMLNGVRHIIGHEWFGENKGMLKANPIPITPEWLERFGFELNDDGQYELNESFWIKPEDDQWEGDYAWFDFYHRWNHAGGSYYKVYIGNNICHVHTLQNLIFALTGEELKIKEQ